MLETKVVRFLLSFAIILFHLSTCFVFGIISPKFVCLDMIIHHTLSKLQAEILKYLHFRLAIMRCYHVPIAIFKWAIFHQPAVPLLLRKRFQLWFHNVSFGLTSSDSDMARKLSPITRFFAEWISLSFVGDWLDALIQFWCDTEKFWFTFRCWWPCWWHDNLSHQSTLIGCYLTI